MGTIVLNRKIAFFYKHLEWVEKAFKDTINSYSIIFLDSVKKMGCSVKVTLVNKDEFYFVPAAAGNIGIRFDEIYLEEGLDTGPDKEIVSAIIPPMQKNNHLYSLSFNEENKPILKRTTLRGNEI